MDSRQTYFFLFLFFSGSSDKYVSLKSSLLKSGLCFSLSWPSYILVPVLNIRGRVIPRLDFCGSEGRECEESEELSNNGDPKDVPPTRHSVLQKQTRAEILCLVTLAPSWVDDNSRSALSFYRAQTLSPLMYSQVWCFRGKRNMNLSIYNYTRCAYRKERIMQHQECHSLKTLILQ